jgi:transposase
VARAALREPTLSEARLEGRERELRLICDHRLDLVAERTSIQQRLRWHLHELAVALEIPPRALDRACWLARLEDELATRDGVQACLARELPGYGALTAVCLFGETAGALRFESEARFAMRAGVAPLPVSSGQTSRYHLDRRGNRQLNAALLRIAINQMRIHEPAKAFMACKRCEGKSKREALRCLKRHLARVVWQALRAAETRREGMPANIDSPSKPALALAS